MKFTKQPFVVAKVMALSLWRDIVDFAPRVGFFIVDTLHYLFLPVIVLLVVVGLFGKICHSIFSRLGVREDMFPADVIERIHETCGLYPEMWSVYVSVGLFTLAGGIILGAIFFLLYGIYANLRKNYQNALKEVANKKD